MHPEPPKLKVPSLKRTTCRLIWISGILLLGLVFVLTRLQWVPAGSVGVIYDARQGLLPTIHDPKAVFVGWGQQLYTYPTKLQAAIYSQDPNSGEVKSADGVLVTTSDNANTNFDITVIYRVKKEDVNTIFKSFGPLPIEQIQSLHLRRAVREVASVIGTRYDVFELMGEKRVEASAIMTTELSKSMKRKGIDVVRVMLNSAWPNQEINQKITARVNSFTELEISRLRREIAEIDRQTAIIKAQAQSTASGIRAGQTDQRSLELLKLEAQEVAIEKWDGRLPKVNSQPGQTIVLGGGVLEALGGDKK